MPLSNTTNPCTPKRTKGHFDCCSECQIRNLPVAQIPPNSTFQHYRKDVFAVVWGVRNGAWMEKNSLGDAWTCAWSAISLCIRVLYMYSYFDLFRRCIWMLSLLHSWNRLVTIWCLWFCFGSGFFFFCVPLSLSINLFGGAGACTSQKHSDRSPRPGVCTSGCRALEPVDRQGEGVMVMMIW